MKRFVDLRSSDTGYRFAWFDTITEQFERHSGTMCWDTWSDFESDFQGEPLSDNLERYRGLTPKWAFEHPEKEEVILKAFNVTSEAQRPNSTKPTCFYCAQPIGGLHKSDCILLRKLVRVRAVVEYTTEVPAFWDKDNIEYLLEETAYPSDHFCKDLTRSMENGEEYLDFTYLCDTSRPFLKEGNA